MTKLKASAVAEKPVSRFYCVTCINSYNGFTFGYVETGNLWFSLKHKLD